MAFAHGESRHFCQERQPKRRGSTIDKADRVEWIPSKEAIDLDPVSSAPRYQLMAGATPPAGVKGFFTKVLSPTRVPYGMIVVHPGGSRVTLARLLAIALVDRAFPVVHPTVVPPRPGFTVLRDDGSFRHQVTKTFAPWIVAEISRLAKRLLPEAAQLLQELADRAGPRLRIISTDSPFRDGDGSLFEFDLPNEPVDLGGFRRDWEGLPRHVLVRREYERDRFMKHLRRAQLDRRARDVFRCFYQIDQEGRITLEPNDQHTHFWTDRLTEIMHEYGLRGISENEYGRTLATEESLARGRDGIFRAAGHATGAYSAPKKPYLVKFGALSHMQDALKTGRIRIGPAASFNDPSLNAARRDNELVNEVDWDSSILPYAEGTDAPSFSQAPPPTRIVVTATANTNFYVFCLASRLRARLFNDFHAEAALVIRDPETFLGRFRSAAESALTGWRVQAGGVKYFDPLNVSPSEVEFPFWKHFAYAYQEEVRIVAIPSVPTDDPQEIFLQLGSLSDIAEIVLLDPD